MSFVPSAEETTDHHQSLGALVFTQVAPELDEE
jgi:hypothetical protein